MIEGWGSTAESIHLRFGIEYHSALQNYDIIRAEGVPMKMQSIVWFETSSYLRRIGLLIESRALASTRTVTLCCHLWSITLTISLTIQRRPTSCPTVSRQWS